VIQVPTINPDSEALDSDKLSEHLQMLNEEVLIRSRLICSDNFGVISTTDPKIYNASSINPLWVALLGQYACTVASGSAITKSGKLVTLGSASEVTLVSLVEGAYNVVFLQSELVSDSEHVMSSTGEQSITGSHYETHLKCLDLSSYNSMSVGSRENTCILAFVVFSASGNKLVLSSTYYTELRPWFSSVDREHRSRIGSGDVTETNTHGLGLNDLSSGGVKLYSQLTSTGMILSKDSSISGMPGYLCFDEYSATDIKVDNTGEVTKRSFFTGVGVYYLELNIYPNTICSVLGPADSQGNRYEYAVDHISGTRILVFYSSVRPGAVSVYYTRSPTLSIVSETPSSLSFAQVDNQELVVASGEALSAVKNTSIFVRKYSGIPVNLRVQVTSSGELVLDPKVVLSAKRPNEISLVKQYVNLEFTSPCYVGIGASKLGDASDLNVAVKLTGIDNQGLAAEEVLEFDQTTWADTVDVVGTSENYKQIKYTSTSWKSLVSVEVVNDSTYPLVSCDPSGYIQAYAKLDPAKHKNTLIATAFWNGRELKRLEDVRRILPSIRDGFYGNTPITNIGELVAGVSEIFTSQDMARQRIQVVASEDFQEPKYLNAPTVIWQGRGILDVDPLPETVVDSSLYTNVYRSRNIPLRKMPQDNLGLVVVLYNVDSTRINNGSVRVVVRDDTVTSECALKLYANDYTKRTFIGYFTKNWKSVSFVISGKCQGFAAYYVNPTNFDTNLVVVPTLIWSL